MLSVVVPVFNEEESLQAFFTELTSQLVKLKTSYEVIFVDDGSTDASLQILQEIEKQDKKVSVLSFRKNHGKADALTSGFQAAKGDLVVTLDADLQDQPKEIVKLLDKQKEGYDLVCGWRKDRKDKSKMKIISKIFNGIVHKVFDISVHDYNCGMKLYTLEAAKSLRLYGGQHRFIPILVAEQGFTIDEMPVEHIPRKYGQSKYGFSKIFKDLPDMFTMIFLMKYRSRPLHFFGGIGGLLMILGGIILSYLTVIHFLGESIGRRPLLLLGILMVLAGIQIFFTGFLAELLIHLNLRQKPLPRLKYSSYENSN